MMSQTAEITSEYVSRLLTLSAWGFKRGFSTFVTIEFGDIDERLSAENKVTHGMLHLWVEMAAWRFLKDNRVLVGSDDEESVQEEILGSFTKDPLRTVKFAYVDAGIPDLAIELSDGLILQVFVTSSISEDRQWTLYLPDKSALTVYGDGRCVTEH